MKLNFEYLIAKRITSDKDGENNMSRPIVSIALTGISLGLVVMILAVAIETGFNNEIKNKLTGFTGHIQITHLDNNNSFETSPIQSNQLFYPILKNNSEISAIQTFATKAGIIKTDTDLQGVILKGVGKDYNWSFFKTNLVEGEILPVDDSITTNYALISSALSSLLKLKLGDSFIMYFVQDPPRIRKFTIKGIYETGLEELDKIIVVCDMRHIQKLNNWEESQISGFEITITDFNKLEETTRTVKNSLGYTLDENSEQLKVRNIKERYIQIFDWLSIVNINAWVVLGLMLLVAGVNMISGLLILILERTRMIGILKALGMTNWGIRKIFIYQSGILILKGLFWGNLVGITLCLLQKQFGIISLDQASYLVSTVPINLNLFHLILLNSGTMLIILVMLIIPSYIITRISPVKTIRFN